jgi:predicted metal-dependent enzyme (double-stranded beta helix superfamily)
VWRRGLANGDEETPWHFWLRFAFFFEGDWWGLRSRDVSMHSAWREATACQTLIADLHEIHRCSPREVEIVARVAERLAAAAAERRWLVANVPPVAAREYRQDVVYVAPDRRFSLVALTWAPGARTPIHDHAGWCVVGVVEGVEHETLFRRGTDRDGPYLIDAGSRCLQAGRTVGMIADGSDIHRVANDSSEITISLHVYGLDIERVGTSVRSSYDTVPVRT